MARGLFVHTSNRLEELLEALATVLGKDPLPPLADETIIVPSQGLARWLRLQLAERNGIAASLQMPFLGAFLQQLGRRQDPTGQDAISKDLLVFRIWRLLRDAKASPEFGLATQYCRFDPDDRKRLQLSLRLAQLFDDYQVYRPDLLQRWTAGDDTEQLGPHAGWQAKLWRAVLVDADFAAPATTPPKKRARHQPTGDWLFPELAAAPATKRSPEQALRLPCLRQWLASLSSAHSTRGLPPRLSVFGASLLPPTFLQLLAACAAHVPVHLFVPQPAPLRDGEESNALLNLFGRESREFARLLADLDDTMGSTPLHRFDLAELAGRFEPPAPATLLAVLQRDIATLGERPTGVHLLTTDDASFRIHECHSAQRELEVVRDQILAAFAADPSLAAHEVLVLVPDIERYAPLAHAVFGPVEKHLPFHVADRGLAEDLPICGSLFALLSLARDRIELHDVFRLLEQPSVHRRFGLFAGDLPMLRSRCEQAGIRWGIDGEARARTVRVPAFEDNAWLPGLHRLLLGVATGPIDDLVLGVLPATDATSNRDEPLAHFVHFVHTLFAQLELLARPHSLHTWATHLDAAMDTLFVAETPDDTAALQRIHLATAGMRTVAERLECNEPLTPTVLQDWLLHSMQQTASPRGFLAGAVTVAALMPMRTVPARCLFVCGLDDASFPRRSKPAAFDLMAKERRPGDRDVRLDDRQVFLEILLAAREQLHITYVARSRKDNSRCAPSVVLDELMDHLQRRCAVADGRGTVREAIVVEHPLQPWSPRYRQQVDARLFTYTDAGTAAIGPRVDEAPWFAARPALGEPTLPLELPVHRLLDFWWQPCRFFLREVCRLRVRADDDPNDSTEPFAVGSLDRWRLQDQIVRRAETGAYSATERHAYARASGMLPVFGQGEIVFVDVDDEAQAFLASLSHFGPQRSQELRVTHKSPVTHSGCVLLGTLAGITATHLVLARMANLKPKDQLRAWIQHVLAATARHAGDSTWPTTTFVLSKDKQVLFQALTESTARDCLDDLLAGYCQGQLEPLLFLEQSSAAYADKTDPEAALVAARDTWDAEPRANAPPPESQNVDNALCMRGRDPLTTEAFAHWAKRIWRPLREHQEWQ